MLASTNEVRSMSENLPFNVVIFSSAAGSDIDRLARRIQAEVPGARVCGVLYEQRPGKPLAKRVATFARNLRDLDFVRYAAGRIAVGVRSRLAGVGAPILGFIHGGFIHGVSAAAGEAKDLDAICRDLDCRLFITADFHSSEALEFMRTLGADLGLVYGTRILRPSLFTIPRHGSINIHKRKVPDYRGGGPVGLWELIDGQPEIGVTVHEVTEKLDAGQVVNAATIPIEPFDTLSSLALKAHVVGNDLLVKSVREYASGHVERTPQIGQGKMFKNPSPQKLAAYERRLAATRVSFQPRRSRSASNLTVRSAVCAPLALCRNWSRRLQGRYPVSILFHHVVTDRPHVLGISTDHFLKQIRFLRKHYKIVSLSEAVEMLRANNVKQPSVVLTLDDGYRDNFLSLRAVREQTDAPMTLFVSTSHITSQSGFKHDVTQGRTDFLPLTWDQIVQLEREGFEIGSHTRTHFDCGTNDLKALTDEIVGSGRELEERLGKPVRYFSFPFGLPENISREAMRIAAASYEYVFSACGGDNSGAVNQRMKHLRRWAHLNDIWELELTLQGFLDFERKHPEGDLEELVVVESAA